MKNYNAIKKDSHPGDVVYKILVSIGIFLFAASFVFILVFMVCNSIRTQKSFLNEGSYAFWKLEGASFKNYADIFQMKIGVSQTTILGMMKNSFIVMLISVSLSALLPVMTGYVLARYKTKLGDFAVNLIILSMVVPAIGSTASTYALMVQTKLIDTWIGMFILYSGGLGFGTLLYKNYFASVSWEYAESAFLDGAGNLTVFFKIMYPQAIPLIVSMGILNVIGLWNDYMTPYLYLNSKPTVALGVYNIQLDAERRNALPRAFAAMTFMTVFVLAIYAGFSKTIMSSMSVGGLKG